MADKRPATPSSSDMMRSAMEPFEAMQSEMGRIQGEMAKMMEAFWGGAGLRGLPAMAQPSAMRAAHPFAASGFGPMMGLPATDVAETDEAFVITAELPGMDRDNIEISATDTMLTLAGEKQEESADKRANYYMSERRYGRFQRAFPIPANVARDKIDARFENGVLTITLPKSAAAQRASAKVEIKG